MIILDTNVISALMRRLPDQVVTDWLDRQPRQSIWTTSVSLFEIHAGLAVMPVSRRREELQALLTLVVSQKFEHRVLAFDQPAAERAAELNAERQAAGTPRDLRDTFIAGIALAHRGTIATRNVPHFDDLDVPVVNPWQN